MAETTTTQGYYGAIPTMTPNQQYYGYGYPTMAGYPQAAQGNINYNPVNGQYMYGAANVTPYVNGAWNQAVPQFYPQYTTTNGNPPLFHINGQVPVGQNYLSEEDLKELAIKKKKVFEIDPIERPRSRCTHKQPAGHPNAGQIVGYSPDGGDTWHCLVCNAEFKIIETTVEEVEALVAYLSDIFDTIKLMWLNVPPQIVEGMYTIMPILNKIPEAYKAAKADWDAANSQGKLFQTNNFNPTMYGGFNPYTAPTQPVYQPYTPYGATQYAVNPQYTAMPQYGAVNTTTPQYAQAINPMTGLPTQTVPAAPAVDPNYASFGASMAAFNPLARQQATTPVAPAPAVPATPTAPAMPTIPGANPATQATTAATPAQPPVGSAYNPATQTGTPDPTTMKTTAQTI